MFIEDEDALRSTLAILSQRKTLRSERSASSPTSRVAVDDQSSQSVDVHELFYSKSPTAFVMSMQSLSLTLDSSDIERERSPTDYSQSMKIDREQQAQVIAARNDEISSKKQNNPNFAQGGQIHAPLFGNPNVESKPLSALLAKAAGTQYKIYLPSDDRENKFITVGMNDKLTIKDAVSVILEEHLRLKLSPPLDYRAKDKYELRLDEGDGEPDYDISIEPNKRLKDLNEGTFCLIDKSRLDFGSDMDDDDEGFGRGTKAMPSFMKPSVLGGGGARPRRESVRSSEVPVNTVAIVIPNKDAVMLSFNEETTLRDLLVPLAEIVKQMRLYSDEYEFVVSAEDQRRCHYAFAAMKMDERVASVGSRRLEIRRKVFADSTKLSKLEKLSTLPSASDKAISNRVGYNDDLAMMYQQWNIIKANAIGKKQRRVLGIDASKIYNAKLGENPRVTQKGVSKAQREISTIRAVERIDDLTFKIVYMEESKKDEIREINCETSNDCNEIVTKLQYLLKMRKANASTSGST